MEKGRCIISIDYEHAWGVVDRENTPETLARIREEAAITERLIALFEKYKIPATWAIVGKLLEERADNDSAWTDTHGFIRRIHDSSARHEIGSHSYAHILYDTTDTEAVKVDIGSAKLIHEKNGFPFRSFVFPRNRKGHHELLRGEGIATFRGQSRLWYHFLPYFLWPLGRGIDYWLPTAHTVTPSRHESGLVNIPDSLLLVSRKGVQKLLPSWQSVQKFKWGLHRAAERKEIFHLWFHPSNFSYDTETQLSIFEAMLKELASMRNEGAIEALTMEECAKRYEKISAHFKECEGVEAWRSLIQNRSPFLSTQWEQALTQAFPYLRFRYFLYKKEYAVRLAHIGNRITSVPFSDGGDIIALTDKPLPLTDFRTDCLAFFGKGVTIRAHDHFCPVSDAEGVENDIVDFRVALKDFNLDSIRKTLRHILEAGMSPDSEIRQADPNDIDRIYKLYLGTMHEAGGIALPRTTFNSLMQRDVFVFVNKGKIEGASVFFADEISAYHFISASSAAGKHEHAPHHLLFHAIKHFQQSGRPEAGQPRAERTSLFLGGTNANSSLRTFKEGWRGEECRVFTISGSSAHESARRSPLRSLWKLIPAGLLPKATKLVGKRVF